MYIVDLQDNDLVYLAWAAGLAQGAGNMEAANSLSGVLSRITQYEAQPAQPGYEDAWENEGGASDELVSEEVPDDGEREVDPQFDPGNVIRPNFGYEHGAGPIVGDPQ